MHKWHDTIEGIDTVTSVLPVGVSHTLSQATEISSQHPTGLPPHLTKNGGPFGKKGR